jgi:hypothetical protein
MSILTDEGVGQHGAWFQATVWYGRAQKPKYNYIFKTRADRDEWLDTKKSQETLAEIRRDNRKAEKRRIREEAAEKFKVGTILHAQWGWEQTNNNFYEVVAKPSRFTVIIREIAQEKTRDAGWATHYVKPVPGKYIGEPMKKRINGEYIAFTSYKSGSIVTDLDREWIDTNYA